MYKPLPKELRLGFSDIHDIGVFAKEFIPMATNFGMTHLQFGENLVRTPLGGFLNHSDEPNCIKIESPEQSMLTYYSLVTTRDIEQDEELTVTYTLYNV